MSWGKNGRDIADEERLNRMLIALADEQRRRILDLVKGRELQPHQIVDMLGEDCRSLSYHLRILRDSRLTVVRKCGRAHHYRFNEVEYQRLIHRMECAGA